MLLLQKPQNEDLYVKVTNKTSIFLQDNGFSPKYLYNGEFYYTKSAELLLFLEEGGK